jgi:membrane-associated phospholipid phosphatase
VLNLLGQGGLVLLPISSALAAAVIWRSRRLWPALVIVVALLLTGVTIGPMKFWADRGYPHNFALAHPEELFSDPVHGTAYPSGHVANAIVWYGVIALMLRSLRELGGGPAGGWWDRPLRVLPPVLVFVCTTYLGFHWITDSVAGLLLGLLLDRLLARVPWQDLPLPNPPRWAGRPLHGSPG